MIILDTDILTLVQRDNSPEAMRIRARVAQLPQDELVATTIITYQEQTRGWLAYLGKARTKPQLLHAYSLLASHLGNFRTARVIPYDQASADQFDRVRTAHPRIGTMDLRVASIAISNDATLVTRNLRDFQQISGLRLEDWTR